MEKNEHEARYEIFTLWVIRGIMRVTKVAASLLLMKVHKDYISNFFGVVSITH